MKYKVLVLGFFLLIVDYSFTQQIVNHHAVFSSGQQNMWGPSFSPVTLDQTITLFNESWNVNYNTGSAGIFTIAGQSFGGALSGGFSGQIGSEIRIEGFTTGTVEVDYPVDIELDMPTDYSYDQGDDVTIRTDYTVESGWKLETLYPSAGEFFWDLYFQMAGNASAQLCFFGCTTFPIIPSFNTGLVNINLVTVSGNGASTGGNTGIWYLGPADMSSPNLPGTAGWPYAKSPDNGSGLPWQVHIPAFPAAIPDTDFGLSGEITIPYVETSPTLDATDGSLNACGDSTYFNLNLEVFKLLGKVLSYSPPPGPVVGTALSNLSGSQSLGFADLNWNFFSASFDANVHNNQCFDFNPKIYGKFEFPVPVDYSITDALGNTSPVSQSSIINLEIGEDINYKFPCYFDSLAITPTYSIDGIFRNHTYDEVTFDFLMSAFEFSLVAPPVTVVPGFTIPAICIPIPYPCPSWSNPFKWCSYTTCTPEIVVPPIGFSGYNLAVGPLWETSIPLGSFSYDWFDQTWSLEGFQDTTFLPFSMVANRLTIDAIASDVDCHRGSNGEVQVSINAVSDALPYSYVWTNGTTIASGGNSETLTGLGAGPYEVSVTDANGCQLFNGATVKEPLPLQVTYIKSDKSCAGGVSDGSIDVSVEGGTSPYTYLWNNGALTQDLNNVDVGTYSLTVTDANGCQKSISATIEEPFLLSHSATVRDVKCNGGSDGSITVSTFGGTLPYLYNWSGGLTTESVSGLTGGTYNLTITDANGCISAASYTVNEPTQALAVTYTNSDVSCFNGEDANIDVTVTGGTPNYNYQWYSSVSGLLSFGGEDPSGLKAATYTLNVVDQNACSETINVVIEEPLGPLTSNPVISNVNCYGDLTGNINPQITGGTSPYNYAWSDGSTNTVLSGVAAGDYSLTIIDVNGCSKTFYYTITQPSEPLSLVLEKTDVKCFGENTGAINSIVSGGTPGYSYIWSNGSVSSNISLLVSGTYSLGVTDNLGCTISLSTTIDEPAAPLTLSSVVSDVLCHDGTDGSIDLTANGGVGPYSYIWSDGATNILSDTTQDLSSLTADNYLVTVTDANQCTEDLISTVNEPSMPLDIQHTVTDVDCNGALSGGIDLTISGGTPNYSFAWSNGAISEDLTLISAGSYTINLTDQNGCTNSKTILVKEPQAPLSVTTFPKNVKCFGDSTGSIETNVVGGTAPYSYSWSNGQTSENITILSSGAYSLTVTDIKGCSAFSGATISEPDLLVVNVAVTDPSCYGYSNGTVQLGVTGGVQPYYFDWGNQNSILLNNPSETINNIEKGNYFIRVYDENGCIHEEQVLVDEPAPFEFGYAITDVSCFEGNDGEIDLTLTGGTTPYSVTWNNGLSGQLIQNLTADSYIFTAIDDQGCRISDNLTVNEADPIQITYDLVPVSCIDQSDAAIYINPYGGHAPYTFDWSNNASSQNVENIEPGFYEVLITDMLNCSNSFAFDIFMNEEECLGIPNTFTPNEDNYNDTWIIENIDLYPNSTVKIFNKWGNEIFSSEGNYIPWDGTHNGNKLPSGVYYYIIILSNDSDNKYTGNLTIVR